MATYKQEWDAQISRKWDEVAEVANQAIYGRNAAIRKAGREALMPLLDWLYVRGEVDVKDDVVGEYVEKLLKDKSSQAYQRRKNGFVHLDSLYLPNQYSFRFVARQSEHEVLRMEMGYEGKVVSPNKDIPVVARRAVTMRAARSLQAVYGPAAQMEHRELCKRIDMGEFRVWDLDFGLGFRGLNLVYMVCDCESKTIRVNIALDYEELGQAYMTPTAIVGDIRETLRDIVQNNLAPEWSAEFSEGRTNTIKAAK